MIEVTGNLWTFPADVRLITTNGTVKKNGEAVMGRGCAAEAKARIPEAALFLGKLIKFGGNTIHFVGAWEGVDVYSFPVKHNWNEKADLDLIRRSVGLLQVWAESSLQRRFVMPRPGCGNGGLKWEDVRPLLTGLPDNVFVITFGE